MIALQCHLRDLAVQNVDRALCLPGHIAVMGNEHDGVALAVELVENDDDLLAGFGIQRAGRLVSQNQLGICYNGSGDSDTLLLSTGKLRGQVLCRLARPTRSNAAFTRFCRFARGTF